MITIARNHPGCGRLVRRETNHLPPPPLRFIMNQIKEGDMDKQFFTLERIGEIVGKNPATIRTHINRGYVVGQGPRDDVTDKAAGRHERFSVHSLTEFFLAYKIERAGLNLTLAFQYAAGFAHLGGTDVAAGGKLVRRTPSLPFHHKHGHTYMGMMAGQSEEVVSKVDKKLTELHITLRNRTNSAPSEPMIVINVTAVFQELCTALGLDWCAVLNANYPEG